MQQGGLLQVVGVFITVIILTVLYYLFPATGSSFHPRCIFHLLTGLNCPGCGSQRAASDLLHGRVLAALHDNLLFVLSLPLAGYSAFVFSWNVFSKRKIRQVIFHSPLFVKSVLTVVMAFWLLRNIPVEPFSWLAP